MKIIKLLKSLLPTKTAPKYPDSKVFLKKIESMWAQAKIDPEHRELVLGIAKQIQKNKNRYLFVQKETGVPWWFIGCIHSKECSLNFKECLHNGDPLGKVTTRVPKGRGPFFTWEDAAIDAMKYDKMDQKDLSTAPKALDAAERYNGLGFRLRDIPSVYIWSHTNQSTEKGKYVADGKWDANAISKNPGVAALMLGLMALGEKLFSAEVLEAEEEAKNVGVNGDTYVVLTALAAKAGVSTAMAKMLKVVGDMPGASKVNYWEVIDYSKHSSKKRGFVFDVAGKTFESYCVAHGKGSDKDNNGYAEKFSNEEGSLATCLGVFKTGETYNGSNGYSMRLHGLEPSNSNAYDRAIVMHAADYVGDDHAGRSWGCPAKSPKYARKVIDQLKNGSYIIAVA